jgi:beta-phosphoglucomutase-like phosphatase (HAD superfamily)
MSDASHHATAAGRYTAVIFDMDGLLIDSEPLWRRAEIEVLGTVGLCLTQADVIRTTGLRIDDVVAFWYRQRPWATPPPEVVAARIVDRVIELVRAEGVLLPGVVAALDFFAVRGLPLGLASSSPWRLIEAVLDCFGLRARFEVVCSAEGMAHGKPHPAVYLDAARRLGHAPTACLALEDSVPGVLAAKAAGMGCIAVPAAEQRDDPRFERADAVLDSLAQLDDARWARLQAT